MSSDGIELATVAPPHPYRGRIAPSPTGLLHLGHARTFLIAARRAQTGTLLLRCDDLDAERVRPEFFAAMLEDLAWLGIAWLDSEAHKTSEQGVFCQSRRSAYYRSVIARLSGQGLLYRCRCSRKDLATAARAPHAEDEDEPVYPGTCRSRNCAGEGALRFRVPHGEIVEFEDGAAGAQEFMAGVDFGDFVVERRDGIASYQLACAADDFDLGITEVVRGRDLLRSTARQILLQRALGWPTPAYYHCALVVDNHGNRLAKRSDALSVRVLRERGLSAQEVRAMALSAAATG